jgi:MSHA biogenesis protein MshO
MKASRRAGFTLVELVAVITLSAILGLVVWRNLSLPIRAFADGARRAELVATGRLAMMRMSREIRLALPNSVRVAGSNQALEFLRTSASGRYRAEANPADASTDPLNLNAATDTFQMLGAWTLPASVRSGAGLGSCLAGTSDCLAIYNTGNPGTCSAQTAGTRTNAWCGDNLAGITSVNAGTGTIGVSRASAGTVWPTGSPQQRFFVVDSAVSFVCAGGELRRYGGYAISSTQPVPPSVTGRLLADHVSSCSFSYDAGSASRSGLVVLQITVSDTTPDGSTEQVALLEQIHVPNSP